MRRIYISTVGRGKALEEASRIYCLDYDSSKILASTKLPLPIEHLKNPRGGVRGARGLAFFNEKLYSAGFDGIFKFDPNDLFIEEGFWSRDFQDIHQIYGTSNCIIGCATRSNKIFSFLNGEFKELDNLSDFHTGSPPPKWDTTSRDTLHFNSIDLSSNLVLFERIGAIGSIHSRKVLLEREDYKGSHDLLTLPTSEIVINRSSSYKTITLDIQTFREKRVLLDLSRIRLKTVNKIASSGWTRGLSYESKTDTLFIGSSPACVYALIKVSSNNYKIKHIEISDDIAEAVFDVIYHPEDWR